MMYIPYCTSKPGEVKTIIFTFVSVNRIIHCYECGIAKFHQGANIHGLRRGSVESESFNFGSEVGFHYPTQECNEWLFLLHYTALRTMDDNFLICCSKVNFSGYPSCVLQILRVKKMAYDRRRLFTLYSAIVMYNVRQKNPKPDKSIWNW